MGLNFKFMTQGAGLELDIEIVDKGDRGIAVIKLYGPSSKKKESVVMATKSKGSESKFVIVLAQKNVKPLIYKFLGDEVDEIPEAKATDKNNISVRGKGCTSSIYILYFYKDDSSTNNQPAKTRSCRN